MITKETRQTIKGYLEGFIQGMIDEAKENGFDPKQLRPLRNESKAGDLKPFHESLLPDGVCVYPSLSVHFQQSLEQLLRNVLVLSQNQFTRTRSAAIVCAVL